jgi:hypothetical protein
MYDGHTGLQQGQCSSWPRPPGHQDTSAGSNPGHQVPPVRLCLQAGEPHPGEDTVQHLFFECSSADRDREALKSAIVDVLGCVSEDQMPTLVSQYQACVEVTTRDFYTGQVPSRVKELLDDSCRLEPWKNDKGELLRYPVSTIHRVVLTWAANLHARRRSLIYGGALGAGLQPNGSLTERGLPRTRDRGGLLRPADPVTALDLGCQPPVDAEPAVCPDARRECIPESSLELEVQRQTPAAPSTRPSPRASTSPATTRGTHRGSSPAAATASPSHSPSCQTLSSSSPTTTAASRPHQLSGSSTDDKPGCLHWSRYRGPRQGHGH